MDDEELKDWEIRDEEPPESLKKKWEKEEMDPTQIVCPSCGQRVPKANQRCLYCGEISNPDSGFLGRILMWLQKLFR